MTHNDSINSNSPLSSNDIPSSSVESRQQLGTLKNEVESSVTSLWGELKSSIILKITEFYESNEIIQNSEFLKSLFISLIPSLAHPRGLTQDTLSLDNSNVLSLAQANDFVSQNPGLSFMREGRFSLNYLYQKALNFNRTPVNPVRHNFNALQNQRNFPHNNGRLCCAHYVSSILGISEAPGSTNSSYGSVNENLVPFLMRRNIERNNGNPGIVFGYKNMIRGDVIVFRGTEDHAPDRYGHVGIVRDTFEYQGVKYLAMQHNSGTINVEIIPVDPPGTSLREIREAYDNPAIRRQIPALQSAYEYRSSYPDTVRFKPNARYYGDATITQNSSERPPRAAFAIRTT